jgi:uncharacterized protein YqjF (DUF2071 family)
MGASTSTRATQRHDHDACFHAIAHTANALMRDRPLEAWETNAPAPFAAMQAADRSTASPQPRQP